MLIVRGSEALSHFRIERLLREIQNIISHVDNIYAQYVYFIDTDDILAQEQIEILEKILLNGIPFEYPELNFDNTPYIIILPKNGHSIAEDLKDWSTNALEIIHESGLKQINQIIRAIVYYIEASQKLTFGDKQAIAKVIMDPSISHVMFDKNEMATWYLRADNAFLPTTIDNEEDNKTTCDHLDRIQVSGFRVPLALPFMINERSMLLKFVSKVPVMAANHNNHLGRPTLSGFLNTHYEEKKSVSIREGVKKQDVGSILYQILRFPAIADKSYLITILDRTAGGLVAQDQMIGPWQIPVSDYCLIANDFESFRGTAFAVGEKINLLNINPKAAERMSFAEAITNIAGCKIGSFSAIQFSQFDKKTTFPDFNDAQYFEKEVGACVNNSNQKFSFNLAENNSAKIIASAPVVEIQDQITPLLCLEKDETILLFVDIAKGQKRLGGSAFAQVMHNQTNSSCPDIEEMTVIQLFFDTMQSLLIEEKILAYHDRSDGGLLVCVLEMAFASQCGIQLDISELTLEPLALLFNEELGAILQARIEDVETIIAAFDRHAIPCHFLGQIVDSDNISILSNNEVIFSETRLAIQKIWSELSYQVQFVRDNPRCAKKFFDKLSTKQDPGLWSELSFDLDFDTLSFNSGIKPKLAILREQGVLGTCEMTKAFEKAGFDCVAVHMDNLESGEAHLKDFKGLAVCGGFSFSDVLGAGQGWANRILFNPTLFTQFYDFFHRSDCFTLGIGNGGQMLTFLKNLIPGAELWPHFVQNYSEQFESRLVLVEVQASPSLFFQDMEGSVIPIPIAHGEGRVDFLNPDHEEAILKEKMITLRYVDNWGRKTKNYPANPDGSPHGITGFTSQDGRTTVLMPHPERAFRSVQFSWHPKNWGVDSPWLKMFLNARKWVA